MQQMLPSAEPEAKETSRGLFGWLKKKKGAQP